MFCQHSSHRLKAAVLQAMLLQLCASILQLYFLREDPFFLKPVGDADYYPQAAQQLGTGQ